MGALYGTDCEKCGKFACLVAWHPGEEPNSIVGEFVLCDCDYEWEKTFTPPYPPEFSALFARQQSHERRPDLETGQKRAPDK